MEEEFRRYGFPDWIRSATRFTKLALAGLLVVGIWSPVLAAGAAGAMAGMMFVAVVAHARISDPPQKFLPATALFALSLFVTYANAGL
jgi:hypothetical protein